MNTWVLDDEQKKLIRDKVAKGNRHLVFLYAPGYCNEKKSDPQFITNFTGINIEKVKADSPTVMRLTRDIWEQRNYWFQNKLVDPLFAVNDKRAEAFGISKDSSEVLFARKNFSDYTSWFIAIPPADPGIWRYIFSEAHAHEYDSTKDVHYSGGSILTIHTADGGDRAIVLKNGKKIELQLPANSTTLLDAETGENLMR